MFLPVYESGQHTVLLVEEFSVCAVLEFLKLSIVCVDSGLRNQSYLYACIGLFLIETLETSDTISVDFKFNFPELNIQSTRIRRIVSILINSVHIPQSQIPNSSLQFTIRYMFFSLTSEEKGQSEIEMEFKFLEERLDVVCLVSLP